MVAPAIVRIGSFDVYYRNLSTIPNGAPPPGDLTPSWTVEYVDTTGVKRITPINNNGTTAITIKQYANVQFDGSASRSVASNCNTAAGAAQLMGYGINYGENLAGTWLYTGNPINTDKGPPLFDRCYTVTGARTVSLYIRDPDGRESTVNMTVNVEPLGSVVDISGGGSWPTWASNTVYGLAAGGDYTSRGNIILSGLTGVRIIKTGSGADPIVGNFQPDSRGRNHGSLITNRSKDCVLVNIDYAKYDEGIIGTDFCGSYGGRCRHVGTGTNFSRDFAWDNEAIATSNSTNAANIRWPRGWFIVNSGPIDTGSVPQYCLIGGGRSLNFAGTWWRRTGGDGGGNPMRTYMDHTVLRNMRVTSTTTTAHYIKGSLQPNVYADTPNDPWPSDDSYGDYALSRANATAAGSVDSAGTWGVGPSYFWICDNIFGDTGIAPTFVVASWGPQNADVPNTLIPRTRDNCFESGYTGGLENNRMGFNGGNGFNIAGRDTSLRNNLQLSGAAAATGTGYNNPRVHPTYQGPYYTSPRPVHSALV